MDKGILYLVATPIGNLEDMSFRAVRILKEVDIIACEDTRHTLKLLNHFEIKKKLESYHEHNKREKAPKIIEWLSQGMNIALVTDAGTPGISDPGEDIVKEVVKAGLVVTLVPGPVAGIMGLVLSGLSADKFVFEGFLPSQGKERKERLSTFLDEEKTVIMYEAPHRLKQTLLDLFNLLGNRKITLARELTKKFEEILRFDLEEAQTYFVNNNPRGEYVLILEGVDPEIARQIDIDSWLEMDIEEHFKMYLDKGMVRNEAIKQVAKDRGLNKREVYDNISKKH